MSELATTEPQGLLAVIQKAVTDKDTDVGKLERLYELYEKDQRRIAEKAFSESMSACQAELPAIVKKAENKQTSSKYAKLEHVCDAITPIYTKHGFSLSFSEGKPEIPSEIRINCIIKHKGGHSEEHFIDLPVDNVGIKGTPNKTEVHGRGSTYSYGRRYLTLGIFNIATKDEDDDGQAAGNAEYEKIIYEKGVTAGCEKGKIWFRYHDTITNIKDRLADNDYLAAAEALYSIPNNDLSSLRRAPTKGGIFTLEETEKMKCSEWHEVVEAAVKANPDVDRSM